VYFGSRRGYVRLALALGVPVVPVATIGSHYTYTMLPGGAWIARVTRMKSWARCERFPLVLGALGALVLGVFALAGGLPRGAGAAGGGGRRRRACSPRWCPTPCASRARSCRRST